MKNLIKYKKYFIILLIVAFLIYLYLVPYNNISSTMKYKLDYQNNLSLVEKVNGKDVLISQKKLQIDTLKKSIISKSNFISNPISVIELIDFISELCDKNSVDVSIIEFTSQNSDIKTPKITLSSSQTPLPTPTPIVAGASIDPNVQSTQKPMVKMSQLSFRCSFMGKHSKIMDLINEIEKSEHLYKIKKIDMQIQDNDAICNSEFEIYSIEKDTNLESILSQK